MAIAPVIRPSSSSGLSLNVWATPGKPMSPSECGNTRIDLWCGGFGLVVFNLRWFRRHWPRPYPEQFGDTEDWINQGEDTQFCRSVVSRGGRIVPVWVPTTHMDSSGLGIIGGSLDYEAGKMVCR